MVVCGAALAAGLAGLMGPMAVFVIFMLGRTFYGAFGSASPPAVQAYIAARTEGDARTNALAAIASSFGLGTIIGPAIAPLFIFPPLGLSAPLFAFALIAAVVLVLIVLKLPDDTPRRDARGTIVAYPAIGAGGGQAAPDEDVPVALSWRDPRVLPWHMIGTVGGHGHAVVLGVIGFLVIDPHILTLHPAQPWIAIVLMGGAAAALFAQRLQQRPRFEELLGEEDVVQRHAEHGHAHRPRIVQPPAPPWIEQPADRARRNHGRPRSS